MRESVHKAGAVAPTRRPILWALSLIGLCCAALLLSVVPARALGPNALMYPTGWNTNAVTRGDDTSNLVVNLPFTMNWLGTNYTQLYLNMNGNVTFRAGSRRTSQALLTGVGQGIMAPFWADVDTRYVGSPNLLYYSNITSGSVTTVNGRKAILVTWAAVQYYNNGNTTSQTATDTFQLVIVDRSDTGAGNFDFIYNYDQMLWDKGTAGADLRAGGLGGQCDDRLRAARLGHEWRLARRSGHVHVARQEVTQFRRSARPLRVAGAWRHRPERTAERDRSPTGRSRATRPTATPTTREPATRRRPTRTARSRASRATRRCQPRCRSAPLASPGPQRTTAARSPPTLQTVVVTDTTSPSAPALSSPTHTAGAWTNIPTVTVNSVNSTDVCTGMRRRLVLVEPELARVRPTPRWMRRRSRRSPSSTRRRWRARHSRVRHGRRTGTRSDATYARRERDAVPSRGQRRARSGRTTTPGAPSTSRRPSTWAASTRPRSRSGTTGTAFSSARRLRAGAGTPPNGGTTWTNLQQTTGASALQGWTAAHLLAASVKHGTRAVQRKRQCDDRVRELGRDRGRRLPGTADVHIAGFGRYDLACRRHVVLQHPDGRQRGQLDRHQQLRAGAHRPVCARSRRTTRPSGWSTAPVTVSLTATDAGSGVAYTRYRVNGGAVATYTAPFTVSAEQTNTVQYWSVDNRGNVETTEVGDGPDRLAAADRARRRSARAR